MHNLIYDLNMVGLSCFVTIVIIFGFILIFASYSNAQSVEAYSRCVLPCTLQGETFDRIGVPQVTHFSKDDPRRYTVTFNSTVITSYCIERTGPFYLVGRTVDGVNEYACLKDSLYDPEDAITILYAIHYRPFSGRPDICEVCDGQNILIAGFVNVKEKDCKIVIPPELGCNIPWYCPVVNSTTQKQCSPCEPSGDDGLCCD